MTRLIERKGDFLFATGNKIESWSYDGKEGFCCDTTHTYPNPVVSIGQSLGYVFALTDEGNLYKGGELYTTDVCMFNACSHIVYHISKDNYLYENKGKTRWTGTRVSAGNRELAVWSEGYLLILDKLLRRVREEPLVQDVWYGDGIMYKRDSDNNLFQGDHYLGVHRHFYLGLGHCGWTNDMPQALEVTGNKKFTCAQISEDELYFEENPSC